MKHRDVRVADAIQIELSQIIREEMRYPVTLFSIPYVKVSPDLTHAKVYVSFFGKHPEADFERIKEAKGFIRSQLSHRVKLRKAPELEFVVDTAIADGARLVEKINKLPFSKDE